MISIPLPTTIPRRKAAKRATVICASNIVIVLVKHRSCDLGLAVFDRPVLRSGDVLHHHFLDVAALAVQHGSRGVDRHADHRLGRNRPLGRRARQRTAERREENLTTCAAKILLTLNLMIWNAAIYSTLVVQDAVLAEL